MAEKLDDLYGDLVNATAKQADPMSVKPLPTNGNEDVAKLKEENETLKRNMGILYRTAKAELERKDKTIEMLHSELDALKR